MLKTRGFVRRDNLIVPRAELYQGQEFASPVPHQEMASVLSVSMDSFGKKHVSVHETLGIHLEENIYMIKTADPIHKEVESLGLKQCLGGEVLRWC